MLSALVLGSLPALGQNSAKLKACMDKNLSQTGMDMCAGEEAKRIDAELNVKYQKLLSTIAKDTVATAKVKAAEKAWIVYRDAYMDAMYPAEDKQGNYGSIFPMDFALLRATLTRTQINAIEELQKQFAEHR
jgi:uncharacterized protein YecT (DUF1311 family)